MKLQFEPSGNHEAQSTPDCQSSPRTLKPGTDAYGAGRPFLRVRAPAIAAASTQNVQAEALGPRRSSGPRLCDKCQSYRHGSRGRRGLQAGTAPSLDCRQKANHAADLATSGPAQKPEGLSWTWRITMPGPSPCQSLEIPDTGQGPAVPAGISLVPAAHSHQPCRLCKGTPCLKLLFKIVNTYKSALDLEKMGIYVYFAMS